MHLFRDTVDIDALSLMGDPKITEDDTVPALAGADRDSLTALLDRAADLGLLTSYGSGYHAIHPALPWFFTDLYTTHIRHPNAAERAYTHAYATLGNYYVRQAEQGRATEVLPALRAEEANLRHALHLARIHHLRGPALDCAQGLNRLYRLTGRTIEWARLVTDIESDYINPDTDLPRPGHEDDYGLITEYRVRIAHDRRDWPTATRLQTTHTAWSRDRAAPYLDLSPDQLEPTGRHRIRSLAASEHLLGRLLLDQGDPACREHLQAAYDLNGRIGDTPGLAVSASNLGNAYLRVPSLRDLDQAQHWHQRDLDLKPKHDRIGRAAARGSLANVAHERFLDASATGGPITQLADYLEQARAGHQQVLDLLPRDHHEYRAAAHNQLGIIYRELGDIRRALSHYQQSIHHEEFRGNTYGAGLTRYNIALLLRDNDRAGDALLYARAALANLHQVGPGAAADATHAEELIQELEQETEN